MLRPTEFDASDESYAPRGLVVDGAGLGLAISRVSSGLGTCIAHAHRTNRGRRATIFLHGAAGSWTTWTPLLAVAADAGVVIANPICVDLPGWGDAELSARGQDAVIDAVSSLVKAAAESLGYTEWDLVGHSMGGFIAMHMAAKWPESVTSVGTISATSWSVIEAMEHPVRRFGTLPGFVSLWRTFRFLSLLGPAGPALVRFVRSIGMLRAATSPLFRHPVQVHRTVVDALADELRPRPFVIAARTARGYDPDVAWRAIQCPVRAVIGDDDVFARPSDLDRLGDLLPDSHRAIIEDCGHFGLIERPTAVLRELGFAG